MRKEEVRSLVLMGCSRKRRLYVAQGEKEEKEEEKERGWEGEEATLTGGAAVEVVLLVLVKGRRRGLTFSEVGGGERKVRGRTRRESMLRILTLLMPPRKLCCCRFCSCKGRFRVPAAPPGGNETVCCVG